MTLVDGLPSPPEYGSAPQYPIDSVDNALQVLLLFTERSTLRMTDVSRYLGVATSTAHRLLAMLLYRGFVKKDPVTRSYVSGPTLDGIAFGLLRRLDVRDVARPVLERLNAEVLETVHLGRLEGSDVHFIDSVESSRALRVGGRIGRSMPAHCTSTGKALLAQLTEEELLHLYPEKKLPQLTPHSLATRGALIEALEQVRKLGYAASAEESEEGVGSVAVALDSSRLGRLAVNVSMPISRMTGKARGSVLRALIAATDELDRLLV